MPPTWPTWTPIAARVSWPAPPVAACRISLAGRAPTSRSTRPARPRSWPCTSQHRRCATASVTWPWSLGSTPCCHPICLSTSAKLARSRQPGVAARSTRRPTAMCAAKAAACWYWNTPPARTLTDGAHAPWWPPVRSTRTAPAPGFQLPMARPKPTCCARPGRSRVRCRRTWPMSKPMAPAPPWATRSSLKP